MLQIKLYLVIGSICFTIRELHRLIVLENWVGRIFESKREEVAGSWRKWHNEELQILYASSDIIWVIKSRTFIWARHEARMTDEKCVQYFGCKI
jgi:hypothetical protein